MKFFLSPVLQVVYALHGVIPPRVGRLLHPLDIIELPSAVEEAFGVAIVAQPDEEALAGRGEFTNSLRQSYKGASSLASSSNSVNPSCFAQRFR